jgi:hypothetical protein
MSAAGIIDEMMSDAEAVIRKRLGSMVSSDSTILQGNNSL